MCYLIAHNDLFCFGCLSVFNNMNDKQLKIFFIISNVLKRKKHGLGFKFNCYTELIGAIVKTSNIQFTE